MPQLGSALFDEYIGAGQQLLLLVAPLSTCTVRAKLCVLDGFAFAVPSLQARQEVDAAVLFDVLIEESQPHS